MPKITINAPRAQNEDDLSDELHRIAVMVEKGFTSGEVRGGWWSIEGEFAESEDE